jgi:hypothetical protein
VNKTETISWMKKWNALYNAAYDNPIAPYRGRKYLDHKALADIYHWKFRGLWPAQKIRTLFTPVQRTVKPGTGRGEGSHVQMTWAHCALRARSPVLVPVDRARFLMAADPVRFTVMDTRAIKSLTHLGLWNSATQGKDRSLIQTLDRISPALS